jgi:hypothetical protein
VKHKSQQLDIQWSEPEAFALMVQTTKAGDRIAAEKAQSEADQTESEKFQTEFQ